MDERKAFSFYRSYYEASKDLPREAQADFLMAICAYIFEGVEPDLQGVASAMFKLAKPTLDTSIKRAYAGQTGGKSKANAKQNESKTETNQKQTASNDEANPKRYMINDLMINDNKKEEVEEEKTPQKYLPVLEAWNKLPVQNIRLISGKRLQMLRARVKQFGIDDVFKAIQSIHDSPFLLGENKRKWQISFDWFVAPNNFPKVLEGNYLPKDEPQESRFDNVQPQQGDGILFMDIVKAYKQAKQDGETRTLQEFAEEYRQKRGEMNGNSHTA